MIFVCWELKLWTVEMLKNEQSALKKNKQTTKEHWSQNVSKLTKNMYKKVSLINFRVKKIKKKKIENLLYFVDSWIIITIITTIKSICVQMICTRVF